MRQLRWRGAQFWPPRPDLTEVHRAASAQVFRPATEQRPPPWGTTSDDNRTTQEPTNTPFPKTALLATPAPDPTWTAPRPEAARATLTAHIGPQAADRCGGTHGAARARSEWMCVHPRQTVRGRRAAWRPAPARTHGGCRCGPVPRHAWRPGGPGRQGGEQRVSAGEVQVAGEVVGSEGVRRPAHVAVHGARVATVGITGVGHAATR